MRELTMDELDEVSGGTIWDALPIWGTAMGIGTVTYGSSWGAVAALAAFGVAPVAALAMVGLAFYGGYQAVQD